jgi:MOSC domain-containing protein YiiM
MTVPPVLLSVNVGLPKNVAWQGKTVYTGVWKHPVDGPAMVRRLNIDSDGQGDLAGHGGEQRAVLVYQVQSYRHWQQHFGRDDLGYGQFGENLTVDGLTDDEVCIGDRYRIGEAEIDPSTLDQQLAGLMDAGAYLRLAGA